MMSSQKIFFNVQALTNSLKCVGFSVILLCSSCVSLNKVTRHSYEVPPKGDDAPKYYINSVEITNDKLTNNPMKQDPRYAKLFLLEYALNGVSSYNFLSVVLGREEEPSGHPLFELRDKKHQLQKKINDLEHTLKKGTKVVVYENEDSSGKKTEREVRKLTQEEIAEIKANIKELKEKLQKVEKNIELETENAKQEIPKLKDEINQIWRKTACSKYPAYFSDSPDGAISIDIVFGPRKCLDVTSGLMPLNSLTSLCGLIYPVFTANEYERNVQVFLKDKSVFSSKISDKKTHASGWLIACIWSPLLHICKYTKEYDDGLFRRNDLEVEPSTEAVIQVIKTIPVK